MLQTIEENSELSLKRNLPIVFSNLFLELSENKVSSFVRKIGSKIKMVQKKGDYSLGLECALDCEENEVGKEFIEQCIHLQWVFNPTPLESDVHVNKGLIT